MGRMLAAILVPPSRLLEVPASTFCDNSDTAGAPESIRLERITILCVDPRARCTGVRRAYRGRASQHWRPELRHARDPLQSRRRGGVLVDRWKGTADRIHAIHARGACRDIGDGCLLRRCCMRFGDGRLHCRGSSGHGDPLRPGGIGMDWNSPLGAPRGLLESCYSPLGVSTTRNRALPLIMRS